MEVVLETKHLKFITAQPAKKTERWHVCMSGSGVIGTVGWFGRWRRYAFFPSSGSVYEQDCLRDIAGFIEQKTKQHRAAKLDAKVRSALTGPAAAKERG